MVGSKDGCRLKQLTTLHLQSGSRESKADALLAGFCLFVCLSSNCSELWRTSHFGEPNLENPSYVNPEVCLQGASRPGRVDNQINSPAQQR